MMEEAHKWQSITIADQNSETPLVRIAVSNVVWMINDKMFWILSKSTSANGLNELWLIWGGAFLYEDKQSLRDLWAFDFEGMDARFKIPLDKLESFIDKETGYAKFLCEEDVMREVREELGKELISDQIEPILTDNQLTTLRPSYMGSCLIYEGDSLDSIKRGTIFRVLNVFSLTCPEDIIKEIQSSSVISLITKKKLENWYATWAAWNIKLKSFIKKTYDHIKDRGYEIKD